MTKSLQIYQQISQRALIKTQQFIQQIHTLVKQSINKQANKQIISDIQNSLIEQLPQQSPLKKILQLVIECHQYFFNMITEQKQIILKVFGLIKQIQLFEEPLNVQKIMREKDKKLSQLINQLRYNLDNLPVNKVKLQIQTSFFIHNESVSTIYKNCQPREIQFYKQENQKLNTKITQYEQKIISIQSKLVQLLENLQDQEIRGERSTKMIDRICKNVFNQQFMIQANFNIRNQYYNLLKQNQMLQSQLTQNIQMAQKIKRYSQMQRKKLLSIIQKMDNLSFNKFNNSTTTSHWFYALQKLQNNIQSLKCKRTSHWFYALQKLQNNIQSLKCERKQDQKLIKELYNKISYQQKSHSQKNLEDDGKKFKKKIQAPSMIQTTKNFNYYEQQTNRMKNTRCKQPEQETCSFQGRQSTNNFQISYKNGNHKNQKLLKYSKSTCTLKQKPIEPEYNTGRYRYNKLENQLYSERLQDLQKVQQIKTSGFFVNPEESYHSNKHKNNIRLKNQMRTKQGKTISNLS